MPVISASMEQNGLLNQKVTTIISAPVIPARNRSNNNNCCSENNNNNKSTHNGFRDLESVSRNGNNGEESSTVIQCQWTVNGYPNRNKRSSFTAGNLYSNGFERPPGCHQHQQPIYQNQYQLRSQFTPYLVHLDGKVSTFQYPIPPGIFLTSD